MTKKILLMGASSNEKSNIFYNLIRRLESKGKTVSAINGEEMRSQHRDWDYSLEGLNRQATRIRNWTELQTSDYAICNFACPAASQREILQADYTVLVNGHDFENFPEYSSPEVCNYTVHESTEDLTGAAHSIADELTAD